MALAEGATERCILFSTFPCIVPPQSPSILSTAVFIYNTHSAGIFPWSVTLSADMTSSNVKKSKSLEQVRNIHGAM